MWLYRKLIAPFVRSEARLIYWRLRQQRDLHDAIDTYWNLVNPIFDKCANWKRQATTNHTALVEDHLRTKAYFIAEKDGFRKDAAEYWEEAKRA